MTTTADHATYTFSLGSEPLVLVPDVPAEVAAITGAAPPDESRARSWVRVGINGVRLPSLMIGGRRYTSRGALLWFFSAVTAARESKVPA